MKPLTQNGFDLKSVVFLIVLFVAITARSQTYPVQAFVQLNAPYSSYLPDYSDPMNNQMKILLTLTDFSVSSYQVKMRLTFEGSGYSISTSDLIPLPTITLMPGVPVEISGSDLAPYLMSSNLDFVGIDPVDYELRKVLPEGPVTICAEVIDFSGPNQSALSNYSCAQVWFSLFDPPLLNLPFCGSQLTTTDPQNILFSWTPLHMSSPFSISGTEYTFELFELRPDDADPNQVVNSSLPIYIEVTTNTFVNYGLLQPQLQLGMSYVWRVKVREITDRDVFRNNGYSTVCEFTYGNIAESLTEGIVLELESEGTGVRQGLAWWNGSAVFGSYELEVRKTGDEGFAWFPYSAISFSMKVNDLEPSTEYECRVRGVLGEHKSEWSNTSRFVTQPKPEYACGSTAQPPVVPDITPLQNLLPGMKITIGQFEMTVSSVSATHGPGRFAGLGRINVPFVLGNIKVKYDDILIDENHFVRSGSVEALTKGMDDWLDEQFTPFEIPGHIDDFEFPGDSTVIVHFDDQEMTFDFREHGDPIYFTDETGKTWTVHSDGSVEVEGGISLSDDQLFATQEYQVLFSPSPDQSFGFDAKVHLAWQSDYEAIELLDGTYYFTPFKSIGPAAVDRVIAKVISEDGMPGLAFKTTDGRVVPNTLVSGNDYELELQDFSKNDFVYAYDDTLKVGKLWIRVQALLSRKVVVVPVNGATISGHESLEDDINQIYKQANVNWDVEIADPLSNSDWDLNGDAKLGSADPSLMSRYSDEMRSLRDQYFEEVVDHDKEAFHLFVVPSFEDSDLLGYMVRGRAVGFIKSGEGAKTISHELGHGAFDLEHTFPKVEMSNSNNLMDYADSVHLRQRQWKGIHENFPAFSFLDDEEDGSASIISNIEDLDPYRNKDGYLCFLSVGGVPITLPKAVNKVVLSTSEDQWSDSKEHLPIGSLTRFMVDGSWYGGVKGSSSGNFYGYRNSGGQYYKDSLSASFEFRLSEDSTFTEVLTGTPCLTSEGFVYQVFPTSKFTSMLVDPEIPIENLGEGPHFDMFEFTNYFDRKDEAIDVRAQFTTELSENQLAMFQQVSSLGEICGANALWAFSASLLFDEHPEKLPCITSILEGASDLEDAFNTSTNTYLDELYPIDEPIIMRPPTEGDLYSEFIANYEGELSDDFFEFFYKASVALIDQISPLQEAPQILGELPIQIVADLLLLFEPYQRECLLKTLPYEVRIKVLKSYTEWGNLTTAKESLLVDLVATTPMEDSEKLLSELRSNSNELFWGLYDDINGSNSDAFLAYVSLFAIEHLEHDPELDEWPATLETVTKFLPIWKHEFPDKLIGVERIGDEVGIGMAYTFEGNTSTYAYTGDPFDFVRIKITEDFQFHDISTGERLKAGDEFIVPAAWAYWIIDRQGTIDNWTTVRIVANIAAVGFSVASGEPIPLIIVEALFSTADISLAIWEDEILSSGSPEAIALFENMSDLVDVFDLSSAVLDKKDGGPWGFKFSPRSLDADIRKKIDYKADYDKFKASLKEVVESMRKADAADFKTGQIIFNSTLENMYKQARTGQYGRYVADMDELEFYVEQGGEMFIKTASDNSVGIGKVMEDGIDDVYLKDLRWTDEFYSSSVDGEIEKIIHFFDEVPYRKSDGSTAKGNLEVVQTTNGNIFVREGKAFDMSTYSGKTTSNLKANLVDLEAPVGEFRQLKSNVDGKTYRAADFWKQQSDDFEHFISADGKYYIKRDPLTGRVMFLDLEKKKFVGYGIDDDALFGSYDKLLSTFKFIHGIDGGNVTLDLGSASIQLSVDKANIVLGRLNPKAIPGGADEIGIIDIKSELGLFRNYSFADDGFEILPNSFHVLNVTDAMEKTGDFFVDYNLDFLKLVTENSDKVRVILATKPEIDFLYRYQGGIEMTNETGDLFLASLFAQEIKYLRENGISIAYLPDGSTIDLNSVDLDIFDWSNWIY